MEIFAPLLHVGLNVPEQFGKQTANITQALTLTLLFRFGARGHLWRPQRPLARPSSKLLPIPRPALTARHRLGRHLGPRCLHRALEPPRGLHGLASGVLQQGYAVGYLIAAVISLELVLTEHVGWRSLFWTASGIGVFGACLCALLPREQDPLFSLSYYPLLHPTPYYSPPSLPPPPVPVVEEHTLTLSCTEARLAAESHAVVSEAQKMRVLLPETGAMPKKHWALACVPLPPILPSSQTLLSLLHASLLLHLSLPLRSAPPALPNLSPEGISFNDT
ncbi:hypothetical protein B0H14DRAFT_3426837 [Mycena olivaceomarginata]|nr:hypothetical protein B0H14DRAFT_3426837 [Mycena olivaceomarginata]